MTGLRESLAKATAGLESNQATCGTVPESEVHLPKPVDSPQGHPRKLERRPSQAADCSRFATEFPWMDHVVIRGQHGILECASAGTAAWNDLAVDACTLAPYRREGFASTRI